MTEWLSGIEGDAKIDHCIGQVSPPRAYRFFAVKADHQAAVGVLPAEGPLNLVSRFVELPVTQTKLSGKDDRGFGVAAIRVNDGFQPGGLNDLFVFDSIKPRIQGEGFTHKWNVHLGGERHKSCQGLGENHTVIAVDRFDTDGADDETVILHDGELFFPFLVLVPRIAF